MIKQIVMKSKKISSKKTLYYICGFILLFVLVAVLCYIVAFRKNEYGDPSSWGTFGDYIGGIVGTLFALISIILIFLTFSEQRNSNELNIIWKMVNDINRYVKEFNDKNNKVKLDIAIHDTLKTCNRVELWNLYDDMSLISNLCLISYEFTGKSSLLSDSVKNEFWLIICLHSKNAAAYWMHCNKLNEEYREDKNDSLKIREKEINNYLDKLNEAVKKYKPRL
jgi:uncharacterized membrane protein